MTSPLQAIPSILSALREAKNLRVLGADAGFLALLCANAALDRKAQGPLFYVARDEASAQTLTKDLQFFMGLAEHSIDEVDGPIVWLPEIDTSPYGDTSADPRVIASRLACLYRLACNSPQDGPRIVITSLRSFLRKVMPAQELLARSTEWKLGDEVGREQATKILQQAGYQRVEVVVDPGTYAVRGDILDVYGALLHFPARLEFFGDELERMRLFDPDSQRSLRNLDSFVLHPVRETIQTTDESLRQKVLALADKLEAPSTKSRQIIEYIGLGMEFFGIEALTPIFHHEMVPLWTYLPEKTRFYIDHPDLLLTLAERIEQEYKHQYQQLMADKAIACVPNDFFISSEEAAGFFQQSPVLGSSIELYEPQKSDERTLIRVNLDRNLELQRKLEAARANHGGEILRPLVERIRELSQTAENSAIPWQMAFVAPNTSHAERLSGLLRGYGITTKLWQTDDLPLEFFVLEQDRRQRHADVTIFAGRLSQGFTSVSDQLLVVSESEIYGPMVAKSARRRKRAGLASLTQLKVGDYVVHTIHGVGRYLGLSKMFLGGVPGDYVQIEYAGADKLYVPAYRIDQIERLAASESQAPKLDKMGGTTFLVKTKRVKQDVRRMAEELLQVYAAREAQEREAYPEQDSMYQEFVESFPFEETPDQAAAIEAVQADLSTVKPMDRLICGDVGFGKTEVALRAAFRVASAGKQVAVLAPTTILVQQHYLTFLERMERFPIHVVCLNRFVSSRKSKQIGQEINSGAAHIVVGTHRLLSRDIRFHNLGLVIIDEEQRFGVAQKDRFKQLRSHVDVLTLTATPIPRTLHLSLLGLREISMMLTPPVDRLSVQTYIARYSDNVLEQSIKQELARGGQVFYVVARIQGIEEHAERIRKLIPEARVVVGHGQMPGDALEKVMLDFVEHRADVLVSTNIIESGLDIPRANTMLIAQADHFGLAQLYQLRGRIGRSKRRAFCYLLIQSLERLSSEARKRLEAIQRHSDLGAGFNIASHDLEIRGAGEILGAKQSGQIQTIGFDTYTRILAEAVAEIRGEPIRHESDPELVFDVPAFLPDTYIPDVGQRLDFYRRLSFARDREEVADVMAELADRYGEVPLEAEYLGMLMICKAYGRRLGALAVELQGRRFSLRLGPETSLPQETALQLAQKTSGRLRLAGGERIVTTLSEVKGEDRRSQLQECLSILTELTGYLNS